MSMFTRSQMFAKCCAECVKSERKIWTSRNIFCNDILSQWQEVQQEILVGNQIRKNSPVIKTANYLKSNHKNLPVIKTATYFTPKEYATFSAHFGNTSITKNINHYNLGTKKCWYFFLLKNEISIYLSQKRNFLKNEINIYLSLKRNADKNYGWFEFISIPRLLTGLHFFT